MPTAPEKPILRPTHDQSGPMTLVSVETRARELIALSSPERGNRIVKAVEEYFMADDYCLPLFGIRINRDRIEDRICRILYACAGQSVPDIHIALTLAEIRSMEDKSVSPRLNA